jgi:hypothetical protein
MKISYYQKLLRHPSKFYCYLVQFNMSSTDGPTDVEMKFYFTPRLGKHIHRHHSDSRCNPWAQIGKGFDPFTVHNVFDIPPEKKSTGVKSGLHGGQLISPLLLIHQPGNCPEQ